MTSTNDWNAQIIAEFRANEGKVGGQFEGAPMVLVHSRGRRSGREFVTPLVCLPDDTDAGRVYIFASKAGAPTNPDWYHNLVAAGSTEIERGTERFPVTVTELTGDDRDRIFAEQVRRMPGFGDYLEKTKGIRTIPVLALQRA
ncbi:MAG: nitroreductase/quinone reductase family protein [Jatrophihabitans sp.]|uniref:nitroreductase/quinone reductase family protein n=1 Tax=Jatrophihabitans sp. TaxID=1932789 RepID=UPI003F7D2896